MLPRSYRRAHELENEVRAAALGRKYPSSSMEQLRLAIKQQPLRELTFGFGLGEGGEQRRRVP